LLSVRSLLSFKMAYNGVILTPEQVVEMIGENFSVMRSDGRLDNSGWCVVQCFMKFRESNEDEYEVTVIKRERGIAVSKKIVTLGMLKKWNPMLPVYSECKVNAPVYKYKEVMTIPQLTQYLGKSAFSVQRSDGTIEKNCWVAMNCYQLDPRDCEDYYIITMFNFTSKTCKVVTLRDLKTWNQIPVVPVLPHERRPDFYTQMTDIAKEFKAEMHTKLSTK
jgi:hypothetical protein